MNEASSDMESTTVVENQICTIKKGAQAYLTLGRLP